MPLCRCHSFDSLETPLLSHREVFELVTISALELTPAGTKRTEEERTVIHNRLMKLQEDFLRDYRLTSSNFIKSPTEATREELHKMRERLTENTAIGRVGSRLGIEDAARIVASLEGNLEASDRHKMVAGMLEGV